MKVKVSTRLSVFLFQRETIADVYAAPRIKFQWAPVLSTNTRLNLSVLQQR